MELSRESWNKWKSRANRLVPSVGQVLTWLALAVVALSFGVFLPQLAWMGFIMFAIFLIVVVADYFGAKRIGVPELVRTFDGSPQIGLPFHVQVQVGFPSLHGTRAFPVLELELGQPASFQTTSGLRLVEGDVEGSGVRYEAVFLPTTRGTAHFDPVDSRFLSPFRLWACMHRDTAHEELLVLPDVTSWRDAVESLTQTLFQEGRHVKRLASGDTDFAYISDYGVDDDIRVVNWAATARRGRLMKNVYEPERGQHIILAIDASRYMGVQLPDGKTRLDHAVDCATALANTALRLGDSVGVIGFSNQINLRIAPDKGKRQWRSIVEGLASLEAKSVQGGYQALFSSLSGRFGRRSLLVVLSEMEGLATDAGFLPAIRAARQKHPTLFVTVTPSHLMTFFEHPPATEGEVAEWASVEWLLEERDELQRVLQRGSVEVIEAPPGQLVTKVVSSYLRRKRKSAL